MAPIVLVGGGFGASCCGMVDLDAAHMCMISKPRELAEIIATAVGDG
jgi:hypothetical protein